MPKEIDYAIKGYQRFRQKYFESNNYLYDELKDGQHPKILVVACSDSRVDPAIVLDCKPGDLFVIRNVANLIPPYEDDSSAYHGTSAALEFGIKVLGIRHIVIFGHSSCGGIRSLVENPKSSIDKGFVSKWMEIAEPALEQTLEQHSDEAIDQRAEHCAHLAVINSMKNLLTFPWAADKIAAKSLFLHGWYFNIASGKIEYYDSDSNGFKDL